MYGSSLMLVTRMPRDSRIAARDAAAMPLPREETTPPVTKTYLVIYLARVNPLDGNAAPQCTASLQDARRSRLTRKTKSENWVSGCTPCSVAALAAQEGLRGRAPAARCRNWRRRISGPRSRCRCNCSSTSASTHEEKSNEGSCTSLATSWLRIASASWLRRQPSRSEKGHVLHRDFA